MNKSARTSAKHQNHSSSLQNSKKLIPLKRHAFSSEEITKRENFFPKKLPCIQVPSIFAKYAHMAIEKNICGI